MLRFFKRFRVKILSGAALLLALFYPKYLFLGIGALILFIVIVILILDLVLDLYIAVVFIYRWIREKWLEN